MNIYFNVIKLGVCIYFPLILQYAYKPDPRKPRPCPITLSCMQKLGISIQGTSRADDAREYKLETLPDQKEAHQIAPNQFQP
jgi:hypothetical protein